MNREFWKNKNVLITGHTGFKGSWLTLWLKIMGANIIGLSIDSSGDDTIFNLINNKYIEKDIRGDITELETVKKIFSENKIDIVFHLAAQALVSDGYENPLETYNVNVIGTQNILEAIRECTNKIVAIFITTDKVYENNESIWGYKEIDALGGRDPYSSSKACCEILINSYRESYFNIDNYEKHEKSIASVRAGNVIGGGDWAKNRIIPDLIRAYYNEETISVRHPESIRPWQHVLEALSGYILLAEKIYSNPKKYCEAWNFGPETKKIYTVKDVVEKVNYLSNNKIRIQYGDSDINFKETNILCLDITKSKLLLGWEPRLNFNETIEMTIEWYLYYKKVRPLDICKKQIKYFMEKQD